MSHAVTTHALAAHAPMPWVKVHAVVQLPQCAGSDVTEASQPVAALPSQSPKPAAHVTWHAPAVHTGVACAPLHTVAQLPQCAASRWRSAQAPPQHVCPVAHACVAVHPTAQCPARHRLPGGQSSSTRHAGVVHWCMTLHESGSPPSASPAQSVSLAQPGAQVSDAVQYDPRAHGCTPSPGRHCTQCARAGSQTGRSVPGQSMLAVHRPKTLRRYRSRSCWPHRPRGIYAERITLSIGNISV